MPFSITIPRLGWSMEEGTFVRWLKQHGDPVQAGEPLFELEGEKASQDVEAVDGGILNIPANAPKPGTVIAVGTVIGYLLGTGEAAPAEPVSSSAPKQIGDKATETNAPSTPPVTGIGTHAASPSVRRMAREKGVKLASLEGSGPSGRITAEDVSRFATDSKLGLHRSTSKVASPRARRVAQELTVDWRTLAGTGRDGRVRESDVRRAASQPRSDALSNIVPVTSRRRTIANRMLASRQQTAPVTLTTRVDATNLVGLRSQFKQASEGSPIPSYSDIVMKLVALALSQHPKLATRSEGDHWVTPSSPEGFNIGFAVDTEDGLVVPVVQSVGTMGLFPLAQQTAALIEKTRSGTLSISEMQGGVFTITNLGAFGIDAFTPIINLPETAVLGMGRILREPKVINDTIVIRDQITLSLTFDHRIVDGAPAAKFLQTLSMAIENPSAWLLK